MGSRQKETAELLRVREENLLQSLRQRRSLLGTEPRERRSDYHKECQISSSSKEGVRMVYVCVWGGGGVDFFLFPP